MMGLRRRVDELRIAMMLLTRLPMGTIADPVPSFAQAQWAFPLAGVPVGLAAWAAFASSSAVGFGPGLAAWLALGVAALTTGGLHHDGLADVADGFWGGHTRARRLEIMRDSRIGSYGVLALVVVVAATAEAIAKVSPDWRAFLAMAMLSRLAMVLVLWIFPPAREDGLGHTARGAALWQGPVALVFGVAGIALLGPPGLAAAGVACLAALGVGAMARAKIGGQTGDVLGATQMIAALVGWCALAAFS